MAEEVAAPAPAAAAPAPVAPAAGGDTPAQTTTESAPVAQPGETKPATEDHPEKRGQARLQRKIDKAYRERAEAQVRAEFFQKRYEETSRSQSQPADPTAPKLEQFESIEKFTEAVEKHASEKTRKQFESERQTSSQRQAHEQLTRNWEAQVEAAEEKYPDFGTVVGDLKPTPTQPWSMATAAADNGGDVAYYLGKHLDELKKISEMPALRQVLEIGKIAHKLSLEPSKPKPSKAPAPITPLGGAASADQKPDPKRDFAGWMKQRQRDEGKIGR